MKNFIVFLFLSMAGTLTFAQGTIQFARWKNDAKGAYSFDSDDFGRSWYGDISFIASVTDTMPGVRLTFATNGGVATTIFWDHANNTLLGHDFVNHSYDHEPQATQPGYLYLEVDSGQSVIEKNIPWQKCLFFVFPGGGSYDKNTMNNYIRTRRYIGSNGGGVNPAPYNISDLFSMSMNYYYENTVKWLNDMVDNAIATGNWSMAASHQLGAAGGWGPMPADTFVKHMQYCWQKVKAGDLWFDGMQHIVKYIGERENFSLQIVTENDTMMEVRFITDAKKINPSPMVSNELYDEPLTLKGTTKFGTPFRFDAHPWKGNVIIKYNASLIRGAWQENKQIYPFPAIGVDKKFISVPETPSSQQISITASQGAEIETTASWLAPDKTSLNGNGTLTINVARNMIMKERYGAVLVSLRGLGTKIVVFKQAASTKFLNITYDSVKVKWDATKTSFYVSTNVSWQASSDAQWFSFTPSSGSSSVTVSVTLTPNPDTLRRLAWVKLSSNEGFRDSIKIIQEAKPAENPGAMNLLHSSPSCFPNPVKEMLIIENPCTLKHVEIFSPEGQKVYHCEISGTEGKVQLNVNHLPENFYLIRVTGENSYTGHCNIFKLP